MNAPSSHRRVTPLLALSRAAAGRLRASAALDRRRPFAVLALAVVLLGVATVALLAQSGGPPRTAFAGAASGQYAVVAKNTGAATVVTVVGATPNAVPIEIATIPHLHGFSLRGAVSPTGRHVALLTPDSAIAGRPFAALIVLDLETGLSRRLAEDLDPLQDVLWSPDATAVVVTRSVRTVDGEPGVAVARVGFDGTESVLETHLGAGMVAPVGFDVQGRLLAVRIDARGSTLTRDGAEILWLSTHVTRDWALSPDGAWLAFVEVNLWQGLRYLPHVVSIEGGGGVVSAASTPTEQALGVAWSPSGDAPSFGSEPPAPPPGSVSAQGPAGFDVPLAYSRDGAALAVSHWSGNSFDEPGTPRLEVVSASGRQPLDGFSRFFGWSAR
ncbi:MAG: hypothetical protein F4X03_08875 [Dehalococcoidia bacterium]|nr:hypothetical protein [Dehalococcoidia bacterium]MYD29007.1 hypothetical protein [Dehalococcoidia bacterium]